MAIDPEPLSREWQVIAKKTEPEIPEKLKLKAYDKALRFEKDDLF